MLLSPTRPKEHTLRIIGSAQRRLRREESGFTLIELLIVVVILGILLLLAVPSYLGIRDRAERRTAAANVRAAVTAVEAFYASNNTYNGLTLAELKLIDAGIALNREPKILNFGTGTGNGYCIQSDSNGAEAGGSTTHRYSGPGIDAVPVAGNC